VSAHFHSVVTEDLSYTLLVVVMDFVVVPQPRAMKKFKALASDALGVEVTARNFPPRTESRYLEWCKKNGINPQFEDDRTSSS
jgi:hypothetical protein